MIQSAVAVPLVDFELRFRVAPLGCVAQEEYDELSSEPPVDPEGTWEDIGSVEPEQNGGWASHIGWIEILFDGVDLGKQNCVAVDPHVLLCAGLRDVVGDLYTCVCGVSSCAGIRGAVAVLHQWDRVIFILPDPLREVDEGEASPTQGAALRVYAVDTALFSAEMVKLARAILEMLSTIPNPDIGPGTPVVRRGYLRKIAKLCAKIVAHEEALTSYNKAHIDREE